MERSKRTPIIAGNWKMNLTMAEAKALIAEMRPLVASASCEVVLCTPYTDLAVAVEAAAGSNIKIGAQNCHWAEKGAFTGEISAAMLAELGVEYVILGHSERRQYFGETNQTVNARLKAVLASGKKAILCVGETLEQREKGETIFVVGEQVTHGLDGIQGTDLAQVIIAYEPVWAIGTGKTATAAQAGETCGFIRECLCGMYGDATGEAMPIQYGGSMNAANAAELLAQPDIDGGLIGGASLKPADFAAIVSAASAE